MELLAFRNNYNSEGVKIFIEITLKYRCPGKIGLLLKFDLFFEVFQMQIGLWIRVS